MGARVFISCGQHGDEEKQIAKEIKHRLIKELGYDEETFVSIEEMSFEPIAHSIFEKITAFEYFLFIDFKRECINRKKEEYRGSLYSHQELAIAAYLGKPFIGFREKGVLLEGMAKDWFSNAEPFQDKLHLVDSVISAIRKL